MSLLDLLYTVALTVALSSIAVAAVSCLWPTEPPHPAQHTRARFPLDRLQHRPAARVPGPTAWTCALPGPPLGLEHAHTAMRQHRLHDCPRKRAAYATLAAYDCLPPAATRRPYQRRSRA